LILKTNLQSPDSSLSCILVFSKIQILTIAKERETGEKGNNKIGHTPTGKQANRVKNLQPLKERRKAYPNSSVARIKKTLSSTKPCK
jgi:hypothetical protein